MSSANLFVIDCITLIIILIKTFDSNHFATFDESFARDFPYFKSREQQQLQRPSILESFHAAFLHYITGFLDFTGWHCIKIVELWFFTFFLADEVVPEPAEVVLLDTWSAGRDSGTGCSVGVLMVAEAELAGVQTGPEDMSSAKFTLVLPALALLSDVATAVRSCCRSPRWPRPSYLSNLQ